MKWLKPWEVKQEGVYLLHRTDDYPFGVYSPITVWVKDTIDHVGNTRYLITERSEEIYVDTFDSECRFFGPIPKCE